MVWVGLVSGVGAGGCSGWSWIEWGGLGAVWLNGSGVGGVWLSGSGGSEWGGWSLVEWEWG